MELVLTPIHTLWSLASVAELGQMNVYFVWAISSSVKWPWRWKHFLGCFWESDPGASGISEQPARACWNVMVLLVSLRQHFWLPDLVGCVQRVYPGFSCFCLHLVLLLWLWDSWLPLLPQFSSLEKGDLKDSSVLVWEGLRYHIQIWAWWHAPAIPALGRWGPENFKSEVSLAYIVSARPARLRLKKKEIKRKILSKY